tara:strand:+ start:1076 stop:2734 length:1659 start_codon:yes stop_codon:yes gene_type:complete
MAPDVIYPTSMLLSRYSPILLLLMSPSLGLAADHSTVEAGFSSILPPLVAIAGALLFRQIIPAIFLGIWVGAWGVTGFTLTGLWTGLLDSVQIYVVRALADEDHVAIIVFSMMIGGMVGIIARNGGMLGVVELFVVWVKNRKRAQLSTGLMGLTVFFDDYANTLVVGSTMRPITDQMGVSREKLAYIVDSTAAPVACLALVTTWIGYEVGLIDKAIESIDGLQQPYLIFLNSLAYSFYPILAIVFVLMIASMERDFGPMLQAERRAKSEGTIDKGGPEPADSQDNMAKEDIPHRAINAALPILLLVVSVLGGLYATGEGDSWREIVGSADSYKALLWGSLLGVMGAVGLSIGQGVLSISETMDAWMTGVKGMLAAIVVLVLAWTLAAITEELGTGDYLLALLGDRISLPLLPSLIFLLAATTAFATGSSWGTMGILMPLTVPLVWAMASSQGSVDPADQHIIHAAIASILAGAVWGDHCSPISDTTILSSMASGCDHIAHVRTQLPYALVVGLVALISGTLPTAYGLPWWVGLLLAAVILWGVVRFYGQRVD